MVSLIATNIKKIINSRGLKHLAVARKAGYTQGQFSNLLNGRKTITDEDILKICTVLNVQPNDLFSINITKTG